MAKTLTLPKGFTVMDEAEVRKKFADAGFAMVPDDEPGTVLHNIELPCLRLGTANAVGVAINGNNVTFTKGGKP